MPYEKPTVYIYYDMMIKETNYLHYLITIIYRVGNYLECEFYSYLVILTMILQLFVIICFVRNV